MDKLVFDLVKGKDNFCDFLFIFSAGLKNVCKKLFLPILG